jgi:RNA polymerase sigma factor (sigma-70 family)
MTGGLSHAHDRRSECLHAVIQFSRGQALAGNCAHTDASARSPGIGRSADRGDRRRRPACDGTALRAAPRQSLPLHHAPHRKSNFGRGHRQRRLSRRLAASRRLQGKIAGLHLALAIARNKTLSAFRRRSDEQLDDQSAAAIEDPADSPETLVDNKDRRVVIRKCLSELSAVQREVLDLVYYHEKSVEEVAQIVGIPANTVKTRMFYARQRMQELLAAAGFAA